ncbi:SAM-dependent methyltransferase [Spongiactinospora sp. 9N601]|uniref:SAM-dependent methyltransferase n=1 Tax=Spongiactinospora sp. 9N601 TaxID=3375149 RepID=UPI0037AB787C
MAATPLPRVDSSFPNSARIYDYMLGGKDNFASDRAAAQRMIEANPAAPFTARANRAFIRRAVRYAAVEAGVRQFLDIGAGLPTKENVHQVALRAAPESRVVYVDCDRCKQGCVHTPSYSTAVVTLEYVETGGRLGGSRQRRDHA